MVQAQYRIPLGISVLFWTSGAFAGTPVVDFRQLEQVVSEELKETNTPGAAVGVVSNGRLLFAKGFGTANLETGEPVTPDMLFRVGSVTKMFTATALISLADEGRIDLNEPIGNYVTGLNPKVSQVTAHQLLTHTGGMTDESPSDYGLHDDSALSTYVRSLKEDHFFTEGSRVFSYSNPGFDVVGLVIEEVGGKPFADVLRERVFRPLAMERTTFRPTVAMTYPLSQGHEVGVGNEGKVVRPFGDNVAGWPDGFMMSSVTDLARFAIAFMDQGRATGKQVLSPAMIAKLSKPYVDIQSRFGFENGRYGYGLFVHDHRGAHVVWHAGMLPGYGALFEMVPAHGFAVIVLANRSGVLLNRTAERAMELMLPLKEKRAKPERNWPIRARELREWIGTYENKPESVQLLLEDGRLLLKREDREYLVKKIGSNRFILLKSGGSDSEEFVLLRGPRGTPEFLHTGRHALRKVR